MSTKSLSTPARLTRACENVGILTQRTRHLLAELGSIHNDIDSARLMSAAGLLSTAIGLLADATGELHQAATVARATSKE